MKSEYFMWLCVLMILIGTYGCTDYKLPTRQEKMEKYLLMPTIGIDINGQWFGVDENMSVVEARHAYYTWKSYPQSKDMVNRIINDVCSGRSE